MIQTDLKDKTEDYEYLQRNHQIHVFSKKKKVKEEEKEEDEEEMNDSKQNENEEILSQEKEDKEIVEDVEKEEKEQEDNDEEVDEEDREILQYQSQLSVITQQWETFTNKMSTFSADKEPWENMAETYQELVDWRDEIIQEIESALERERELERLGKNIGPLTEKYKVLLERVILTGFSFKIIAPIILSTR